MKLMKHITIALVLSVIPAMAFGQVGAIDAAMVDVLCPAAECHTATYFQGSGGFVGMATEDDEDTEDTDESEVAFIVSCGATTTRAVAEKDEMGVVRQVFNEANGLACAADGEINIHRLMPGGWYWINDGINSAVGSLLPKTVLKQQADRSARSGRRHGYLGRPRDLRQARGLGPGRHPPAHHAEAAGGGMRWQGQRVEHVCSACELHDHDDDAGRRPLPLRSPVGASVERAATAPS